MFANKNRLFFSDFPARGLSWEYTFMNFMKLQVPSIDQ